MRGVILIGGGCWRSEAERVMGLGIPVMTTWQAADYVDNRHPNYFGRPGIWGMRHSNLILDRCELIENLGSRLSVWTVGYQGDIAAKVGEGTIPDASWLAQCTKWRKELRLIESPTHDDPPGGIHPYRLVKALEASLTRDAIVVTDMGTALTAAFQTLLVTPPQRLMTSGGLGEMGCGLPAAIGAAFSSPGKEVICLTCDGGMMLNLQELATIAHHRLQIKIVVFENDGYAMIRQTQRAAGYSLEGVGSKDLSFPNFRMLAQSFGIRSCDVTTWAEYDRALPEFFGNPEPAMMVYHFQPKIDLLPKLMAGNKGFADMSPAL